MRIKVPSDSLSKTTSYKRIQDLSAELLVKLIVKKIEDAGLSNSSLSLGINFLEANTTGISTYNNHILKTLRRWLENTMPYATFTSAASLPDSLQRTCLPGVVDHNQFSFRMVSLVSAKDYPDVPKILEDRSSSSLRIPASKYYPRSIVRYIRYLNWKSKKSGCPVNVVMTEPKFTLNPLEQFSEKKNSFLVDYYVCFQLLAGEYKPELPLSAGTTNVDKRVRAFFFLNDLKQIIRTLHRKQEYVHSVFSAAVGGVDGSE